MNFLEELQAKYGAQVASQVSARFGVDPDKAADILPRMAPFVLGGVQAQMEHPEDHQSAHRILENHADESSLDDLDGHFERTTSQAASGPDSLEGIFGSHAPEAQKAMANQLGVSSDTIAKLLPVLAPIILASVMGKMKGGQNQPQQGSGGGGMDILGSILGQQGGGGNILGSILGSVLGGGGSAAATGGGGGLADKAGCLSAILGSVLKGRK